MLETLVLQQTLLDGSKDRIICGVFLHFVLRDGEASLGFDDGIMCEIAVDARPLQRFFALGQRVIELPQLLACLGQALAVS